MENLIEMESSFTEDYVFLNDSISNDSDISVADILGPKRGSLYAIIPVTIIYVIIFITGLVGNISTCVVISRNKFMHTATNYYLYSLAISDLLLLISGLPQEMFSIWSRYPYIFGQTFCILRGLFSETSANATVLTITAFTVERYLAICHPFLSHTMSKLSRAVKFILIIWVVAIFFAIPQALQFDVVAIIEEDSESEMCQFTRTILPHSFEFSTFVFFIAPMSLITVLYALIGLRLRSSNRMKKSSGDSMRNSNLTNSNRVGTLKQRQGQSSKRVLKMLVAVVVAFFVCWAPFHTQRLVAIYGTIPTDHEDRGKLVKIYEIVTYISGVLYYMSTTINPLLYNIMSNKFREAFKETFSRCCGLACIKAQRPQCSYSILSRSLRRGPDSHTDSTGRDDPSVQTNITFARKSSQESMNVHPGINRVTCKGRLDVVDSSTSSCKSRHPSKFNKQDKELSELTGKFVKAHITNNSENRSVKFWNCFVCVAKTPSEMQQTFGMLSSPTQDLHYNIDLEKTGNKRNLSTSSCDISNSSLRDIDNAVLEDELANYLRIVKFQQ